MRGRGTAAHAPSPGECRNARSRRAELVMVGVLPSTSPVHRPSRRAPTRAESGTTRVTGISSTQPIHGGMVSGRCSAAYDRVVERRRAVALARHFRRPRVCRSPRSRTGLVARPRRSRRTSTTRLMLTKGPAGNGRPSQEVASSGVTRPPRHHEETSFPDGRCSALGWLSSTAGRLGVLMLDGSRNGAARRNSPATTETRRVCRSPRSLVGWDAQKQPSRRISTIQPAIRHARSRRATGECVAAAGRPPRHGTARATPTRIANAAIPARSRGNGLGNGFAKRCAHGERATALRRRPTTGRAPTHAGAAPKRSNDSKPENGPRRPPSSICTGAGRRPSPTPSRRLSVRASRPLTYERGLALDRM